ncbi:MAG: heterocyst-inhibiting protein PatX [Heteroscytonema crispum UTEX LB 1556]
MRVTISLFVTSQVFGSLAFNSRSMVNSLSNLLHQSNGSGRLLSAKPAGNQPKKPVPHRGSGRKMIVEQFRNTRIAV